MPTSSLLAGLESWKLDSRWLRGLLAAAGLLCLVGVEQALNAAGFKVAYLAAERASWAGATLFALAAVFLSATLPRAWRGPLLVVLAAAAYPYFLGRTSVLVAGYVLAVCAVARSGLRLRHQVGLSLLVWAIAPTYRWVYFPGAYQVLPERLMVVWTGLAYSTVYLLVERSRLTAKTSWGRDLFYLVALPRVLTPFWQPISPALIRYREISEVSPGSVVRAVALGTYGLALSAIVLQFKSAWSVPHQAIIQIPIALTLSYCQFAKAIFGSISFFRLLGFDLPSGFRQPFLAESYADFFSRWNHYVRDAVLSLFFIPWFVRLRRRMPPRVATIAAGFLSIFVGSFLLNKLLIQFAASPDFSQSLIGIKSPWTLFNLSIYWLAIILPSAARGGLGAGPRAVGAHRRPRWVRVGRFLISYVALYGALGALYNWTHGVG